MTPQLFGIEHILYIIISASIASIVLLLAKRYARTERAISIFLKAIAIMLFAWIVTNRLSQVFRYEEVRW